MTAVSTVPQRRTRPVPAVNVLTMEGTSDHWGVEVVYSRRGLGEALRRGHEPLPPVQAVLAPAALPNAAPGKAAA